MATYLKEGQDAKAQLLATAPVSEPQPDGTTKWAVEMGTSTAHTDVLASQPVATKIKAGDTVVFVNNSTAPHTATFANGQQVPPPGTPGEEAPSGPSPITLAAGAVQSSGFVPPNVPGGPPPQARRFEFTIPNAGEFVYICVLHIPSGMQAKITAQ